MLLMKMEKIMITRLVFKTIIKIIILITLKMLNLKKGEGLSGRNPVKESGTMSVTLW